MPLKLSRKEKALVRELIMQHHDSNIENLKVRWVDVRFKTKQEPELIYPINYSVPYINHYTIDDVLDFINFQYYYDLKGLIGCKCCGNDRMKFKTLDISVSQIKRELLLNKLVV
jgi:hypothetical protein